MNYIKKKIKGSKKCDSNFDDLDSSRLSQQQKTVTVGQVEPPPFEKPTITKTNTDSEEWKAFQLLTQRVQDTVQKTQDSLTKLKETTVSTEVARRAEYDYVSSDEENTEQLKAPVESLKSWIDFSNSDDSRTLEEITSPQDGKKDKPNRPPPPAKRKAPCRPPPPAVAEEASSQVEKVASIEPNKVDELSSPLQANGSKNLSSQEVHEDNSVQSLKLDELDFSYLEKKSNPTEINTQSKSSAADNLDFSYFEQSTAKNSVNLSQNLDLSCPVEYSLDDDFGFENKSTLSISLNPCNTLLLEEDGQPIDDPFDTSHVDIITQATAITPCIEESDPFDTSFVNNIDKKFSSIMSNPFLTDCSESIPVEPAYDIFNVKPVEVESGDGFINNIEKRSNNPFLNCNDENVDANIFENIDPGVQSKDLFGNDDVQISSQVPDLFAFDEKEAKPLEDVFSGSQMNSGPFTVCETEVSDPFGPVEPEMAESIAPKADPSANNLRIDVSKLDFFNTKGAVSPGVSPRHSPILEEKDFGPIEPIDIEDFNSDNHSEDSVNFQEKSDNLVKEEEEAPAKNDSLDLFAVSSSDFAPKPLSIVPTIELTESEAVNNYSDDEETVEEIKPISKNVSTEESNENDANNKVPSVADIVTEPISSETFAFQPLAEEKNNDISEILASEPKADSSENFMFDSTVDDKIKVVPDIFDSTVDDKSRVVPDIFNSTVDDKSKVVPDIFDSVSNPVSSQIFTTNEAFDAFAAKFENTSTRSARSNDTIQDAFDPFGSSTTAQLVDTGQPQTLGFNDNSAFDPFMAMTKPPKNTPIKNLDEKIKDSFDDDDDDSNFAVIIKPKMTDPAKLEKQAENPPIMPLLPPPPKAPVQVTPPDSPEQRFNPFNKESPVDDITTLEEAIPEETKKIPRTESEDSGTFTPLYDEDTSQPLEDYPAKFEGDGWEMMLRQPTKKKITGNRFWKKIYVRLKENTILMLYNTKDDSDPFQELPLQACYSLSEASAQQYDSYGKIFTVKLQYVFYREKVGVRPGQISKVVQGHITSVGQLAKLGLPLEHAPQVSQLLKLGSQNYKELQTFIQCIEDALFHLSVHRDRALQYKNEEIQVSVYDEFYADINKEGKVLNHKARVRLFFLAFIGGMPDVEVGLNDLDRQGKEVVGRHDIIPVVTEEWIRLEKCEFHSCVIQSEFEKTKTVKLHPPDACLFELMRFRIRPPRNRELPLHLKLGMLVSGSKVEIRGDILVPGYHSRKHGQVHCEDISIRIPIPECWIYLFRVEKHFRYGSLKSAHRKAGKIKGLERIIGAGLTSDQSLIEVSTGQAKYEHAHHSIVWRMPRLPKEGQGAYSTHLLLCRLELTSFDQLPDSFEKFCFVEYTMSASTVSHTTVRSISVSNQNPPEKFVKYLARYEYQVEIDHTTSRDPCEYKAVTSTQKKSDKIEEEPAVNKTESDPNSDDQSV